MRQNGQTREANPSSSLFPLRLSFSFFLFSFNGLLAISIGFLSISLYVLFYLLWRYFFLSPCLVLPWPFSFIWLSLSLVLFSSPNFLPLFFLLVLSSHLASYLSFSLSTIKVRRDGDHLVASEEGGGECYLLSTYKGLCQSSSAETYQISTSKNVHTLKARHQNYFNDGPSRA